VVAFDPATQTGFYMMHTTPGWPNPPTGANSYDNDDYAQDFFCINIDVTNLNVIGKNLFVTRPQIYFNSFTDAVLAKTPDLKNALNKQYNSTASKIHTSLKSRRGQSFEFFFKNREADVDIWADLVASEMKSSLLVETWLRDTAAVASCGTYKVQMVGSVTFGSQTWKETQDHCKWGVSEIGNFACFSDINFQASQANRGGGAICMRDSGVAQALLDSITTMSEKVVCK